MRLGRGRQGIHTKFWRGYLSEIVSLENRGEDGKIPLTRILGKYEQLMRNGNR
jgi:hypothetical protein